MKKDPFTPNLPINDPGRFYGRIEELRTFANELFQIKNGGTRHLAITGERGIGKSSFLNQTLLMAQGNMTLPNRYRIDLEEPFKFRTITIDAKAKFDLPDLCDAMRFQLQTSLQRLVSGIKVKIDFKVFSVDFPQFKANETMLEEEFANLLRATWDRFQQAGTLDGLLIAIDEVDRLDPRIGIATFFKLVAENLHRSGYGKICFIICGITGAVQRMKEEHESIRRTFNDIKINELTIEEVAEILGNGFGGAGVSFDPSLPKDVLYLSKGFPEPVHFLGSHCIRVDTDDFIDLTDLENAKVLVVTETLANELASKLRSAGFGKYQRILEAAAGNADNVIPLSYIAKKLGLNQNQFSTNMATLVERGILRRVSIGAYEFIDPLLRIYIQRFGVDRIGEGEEAESKGGVRVGKEGKRRVRRNQK